MRLQIVALDVRAPPLRFRELSPRKSAGEPEDRVDPVFACKRFEQTRAHVPTGPNDDDPHAKIPTRDGRRYTNEYGGRRASRCATKET